MILTLSRGFLRLNRYQVPTPQWLDAIAIKRVSSPCFSILIPVHLLPLLIISL